MESDMEVSVLVAALKAAWFDGLSNGKSVPDGIDPMREGEHDSRLWDESETKAVIDEGSQLETKEVIDNG